jgi:hypothetical protein
MGPDRGNLFAASAAAPRLPYVRLSLKWKSVSGRLAPLVRRAALKGRPDRSSGLGLLDIERSPTQGPRDRSISLLCAPSSAPDFDPALRSLRTVCARRSSHQRQLAGSGTQLGIASKLMDHESTARGWRSPRRGKWRPAELHWARATPVNDT